MRWHWRCCCALAVVATGLVTPGCVLGKNHKRTGRHEPSHHNGVPAARWTPLREQSIDAATTLLFDPAVDRTQAPGKGGFIMGNAPAGDVPWQPTSKVAVVPGRYRQGVQSANSAFGYLWMPSTGLLSATAFTIEFWAKSNIPFSAIRGETPVTVSGVGFSFSDGFLSASLTDEATYPAATAAVQTNVRTLPTNVWVNIALTYSHGQLILYVNGRPAATKSGVSAPQVWSDVNRSSGLTVGGAAGKGATNFAVSDLRISRVARSLGKRQPEPQPTLSVTTAPTGGHIRQTLLGGLHTLTTPATERMAHSVLRVIRTDKLINSTPIKVGPPDSAHPSAGVSGAFSYNWGVVDRTMAYLRHLGVKPYLSVDATPQLLGGQYPPFASSLLRTARSYMAPFPIQVPNNLRSWQQIVRDLTFHILKQDHTPVAYWGVWNEPDGAFWSGTQSQYLALYEATVNGIRAADPRAVVGGAETARWDPQWVAALIAFCSSRHLPLDFVSWHYYSGDLGEISEAQATVSRLAAQYRMPRPFLNVGEWSWQLANRPVVGALPFRSENYFLNDWGAAFVAASLIEMQRDGVEASIYTRPVATQNAIGLMSPGAPWANLNVYSLWHALPGEVVRTSLNADPGIFAVTSKDRHHLAALIVSIHYPLGGRYSLTVRLPKKLAGEKVRVWLIDRSHADAYDAGPSHARLHSTSETLSARSQLHLVLRPRAIVLVDAPLPAAR